MAVDHILRCDMAHDGRLMSLPTTTRDTEGDYVRSPGSDEAGSRKMAPVPEFRRNTEATFGRGDLSVCPLGGFIGAQECHVSNWKGVPQGSPQRRTLRALLLNICVVVMYIYIYVYVYVYIYIYIYI